MRAFADVARDLGLAATMAADLRATMTPETWARVLGESDTWSATRTLQAGRGGDTAPHLPRLSLRLPLSVAPSARSVEQSGDDLVVRSLLAEGGMGRLYVAEQRSLSREVVVKTVRDRGDEAQARALVAEGTITGALEHPNITPVHLAGLDEEGAPLLVMKRISGVSWGALLEGDDAAWERVTALSRDRSRAHLEILLQVASAIHFAHEHGVVHRDIKPDNVMVGSLGEVYVVDWGVATRLRPDRDEPAGLVGTPCFAAPEMLVGRDLGPHTDVYLLGATLHFVLTGKPRHEGDTLYEVLEAAWCSEPYEYADSLPEELARLANAATSREPRDRPESALAFRRALADHLEHVESMRLAATGSAKLAELGVLRAQPAPDPVRRSRLVTEAQFSFQAAIASWRENARAVEGLRSCRLEAFTIELERENLEAARVVASELGELPPELEAELAALTRRVAERAEAEAKLRKLEHDSDVGVGAATRNWLLFALVLASVGLAYWLFGNDQLSRELDPSAGVTMFFASLAIFGFALVGAIVFRRSLGSNRLNRQLVAVLLASLLTMVAHRGVDALASADPIVTLRGDLMLMAAACFAVAVFVRLRAAYAGACYLAAGLLSSLRPPWTAALFSGVSVVALLLLGWALHGSSRPPDAQAPRRLDGAQRGR